MFSFLLGDYSGVNFLGYMVNLCYTFEKLINYIKKMAVTFYFPTSNA